MRALRRVLVPALTLIVVAACADATPRASTATVDSTGAVVELRLARSIEAVSSDEELTVNVEPELDIGRGEPWFGAASDVEALDGGAFAVLDRMLGQVILIDSTGSVIRSMGRPGRGPGEFRSPWALARSGDHLIVWQPVSSRVFTVYGIDGQFRSVASVQAEGDWIRPFYRHPYIDTEDTQRSPEDVTRRLTGFGDNTFLHLLQIDEFALGEAGEHKSIPTPAAYLLRYNLDGLLLDTIVRMRGAETRLLDFIPGMAARYEQPLYVGRPLFAVGDGWYATAHGDSAGIDVYAFDATPRLRISWPRRRRLVTDDEKIEAAKWILAMRVLNSEYSREFIGNDTRSGRRRGIRSTAFEYLSFADSIPHVTGLYGAGRCLFVSGHLATDYADGTSLDWLVFNVEQGSLKAVVRLEPGTIVPELWFDRSGQAVRDFSLAFAYTTYRDGDGVWHVRRYALPRSLECG